MKPFTLKQEKLSFDRGLIIIKANIKLTEKEILKILQKFLAIIAVFWWSLRKLPLIFNCFWHMAIQKRETPVPNTDLKPLIHQVLMNKKKALTYVIYGGQAIDLEKLCTFWIDENLINFLLIYLFNFVC